MFFSPAVYPLHSPLWLLEGFFLCTVLCKEMAPGQYLNVWQSSFAYCSSGIPNMIKPMILTGKIFRAWMQCTASSSLPPLQNRMGACGPHSIHPCRPLVFIGTDTKWPLHHHQRTQMTTNMLPWSERRLDGLIPKLLLRDLWPIGNNSGTEREIVMQRGSAVYKYLGNHFNH